MTIRTFAVSIPGEGRIGEVYFVGEEYDAETVRKFLIREGSDRRIIITLIKEMIK